MRRQSYRYSLLRKDRSHGCNLPRHRPRQPHCAPYRPGGPLPIQTSRKGWGRIAIANSDAGAYAYTHSAIDQGVRAARELLGGSGPAISDFPGPPQSKLKFFGS